MPINNAVYDILCKILGKENVKKDVLMSGHTSFKTGGPADIMVMPQNEDVLIKTLNYLKENKVSYYMIGNGTNIIVKDKGIRGVVIKTAGNLDKIRTNGCEITAQAGALLSKMAKKALDDSLSGLEFASGIPGTVGGAVVMNAGAYGGEIKDVIKSTRYYDHKEGKILTLKGNEHGFSYRDSVLKNNKGIMIESTFCLKKKDKEEIRSLMNDFNKRRREKQPLTQPSAGSTFKRPKVGYASKLIDDCGLKGYKYGGAKVSEKHAGFIINENNAKSYDILKLIDIVKETVLQKTGIELEMEVSIIGE